MNKAISFIIIVIILSALFLIGGYILGTCKLKGEVIDAISREPIKGANITAFCHEINWVGKSKGGASYNITSNIHGNFELKRALDSIANACYWNVLVFTEGYYPFYVISHTSKNKRASEIKMYPIRNPQNISIKKGIIGIKNGTVFGYDISEGNITYNLESADIFVKDINQTIFPSTLVASGDGGFIAIPKNEVSGGIYTFYSSPQEAPLEGYQKEISSGFGMFFFRTADGKHYGKIDISTFSFYYSSMDFDYIYNTEADNRNLEIIYPTVKE